MFRNSRYLAAHAVSFIALCAAVALAQTDIGLTCSDHPSPLAPDSGPLIRSWEYVGNQRAANIIDDRAIYHPRYDGLPYYPASERRTSNTFEDLDLFYIFGTHNNPGALAKVHFQRPARVYMFVNTALFRNFQNDIPELRIPGWTSVGWARFRGNSRTPATIRTDYGLHQTSTLVSTREMMVFMTETDRRTNSVDLPTTRTVSRSVRINGRRQNVSGFYHIRVAEANGRASDVPTMFGNVRVGSNQACPAELHAAWEVPDDNAPNDPDTRGMTFGSWHPMWDPCYWCSYGHEHGSAAPFLMNYRPKYGLTHYKFARTFAETNEGFKDFVIPLEDSRLIMYVSVHVQTARLGRVNNAFHTVTIVVNRQSNNQRMMEISFKADFGFLSARGVSVNSFVPLTAEGRRMQAQQSRSRPIRQMFRSINVIDLNNLDDRFSFLRPDPLVGRYEEWVMTPPCSNFEASGEIKFDIQNPITGIDSIETQNPVILGRRVNNERSRRMHTSLRRTIRSEPGIEFSPAHCDFENFSERDFLRFLRQQDGHFYTDALMTRVEDGPGENNVKQFIDPRFSAMLEGTYKPDGMWLGLHKENGRIFFADHGFGTDPSMN